MSKMIQIDKKIIDETLIAAKNSPRLRQVKTFSHENDKVQRMINVLLPDSVVEPHFHHDTFEVFIAIDGKLELTEYDSRGNVIKKSVIEAKSSTPAIEVSKGCIHSLRAIDKPAVVYIVMEGPYNHKTHKTFPNWS